MSTKKIEGNRIEYKKFFPLGSNPINCKKCGNKIANVNRDLPELTCFLCVSCSIEVFL